MPFWMGGMRPCCIREGRRTSLVWMRRCSFRVRTCWLWKCTTTAFPPQTLQRARFCSSARRHHLTFGTPPTWFQEPASNSHDVTFNVNMANEAVSPEGVFLAGGGNFGFPGDFPMNDDDGDGIWSITVQVPSGFTSHYTFTNGACQDWSCKENLVGQLGRSGQLERPVVVQCDGLCSREHLLRSMHNRWHLCGDPRVHRCRCCQFQSVRC